MADIIEFNSAERAAKRNPGAPATDLDVLRQYLIGILVDARDLQHARQMASEALDEVEGRGPGSTPA